MDPLAVWADVVLMVFAVVFMGLLDLFARAAGLLFAFGLLGAAIA